MTKIDFTKIEEALTETLRKVYIQRLAELAVLAQLLREDIEQFSPEKKQEIFSYFQEELKKIQTTDPKLYNGLNLSPEEEDFLFAAGRTPSKEDWTKIKTLNETIDELKKHLQGIENAVQSEQEQQIETARRQHIYKRFNIREGWLPLHSFFFLLLWNV